ncbi:MULTISPECIES: PLDc N-terminal domain-containing protein [unclassified Serinicoccus]|uniref:PLDc N-terminal domain-containing protein n=1 Tax=unclassified Serinicoccus TaxID=2643101 RepID=UPI0038531E8A
MPRVVIAVALLAFTVYCVVDAVQTESRRVRGLPKLLWVAVVLLVPVLGGIAWLIAGRPRSILDVIFGTRRPGPPRGPLGPDDDPDFLRDL